MSLASCISNMLLFCDGLLVQCVLSVFSDLFLLVSVSWGHSVKDHRFCSWVALPPRSSYLWLAFRGIPYDARAVASRFVMTGFSLHVVSSSGGRGECGLPLPWTFFPFSGDCGQASGFGAHFSYFGVSFCVFGVLAFSCICLAVNPPLHSNFLSFFAGGAAWERAAAGSEGRWARRVLSRSCMCYAVLLFAPVCSRLSSVVFLFCGTDP